ncbi:MAG TPA: AbrB/MazE/SpoVT family DNA-binding domain-containing protein [Terriglobales bacterium]|nr:AbrB/MazE/SpoVT family DNA-binding domain-containing protein [Terriglobales bacterium]
MVYAILDGMEITIDKAGRIVLPKQIRDRFRLRAGARLELKEAPEGFTLRPVEQTPSMVQENGLWVHTGRLPREFSWDTLLDEMREERIKDLTGQ